MSRIYLSPPHLSGSELDFVHEAFESNWIAPLGPQVDAFEKEFAAKVQVPHAAALSSGTAALHLALRLTGVGQGDEVLCSDLTFVASANAVVYLGGTPVFVDADRETWNMDPALLAQELEERARGGRLPKAVIVVDLYGQCAEYDPILSCCEQYGVPVIEDAAEALGASYKGRPAGSFGAFGVFSFNGNKILTTSGGGMLVSADAAAIDRSRFLASQARDPAPHYEHSTVGYNYRMSNVLAALGRGQLQVLEDRVGARRRNFDHYFRRLDGLAGLDFMPEGEGGRASRWLTCATIDPRSSGTTHAQLCEALEARDIEARPVWKPMHLQPLFGECRVVGGAVSERLFETGVCFPSGSSLTPQDLDRICDLIAGHFGAAAKD
jgi:pyridoxal phosphate-dependent aminotransferase EpsN